MNVSPAGGGTIKIDQNIPTEYPAVSTINNGTSVVIEAIPAPGYQFTGWGGNLTSQENPTIVVMTCSKTITANFYQKTYRLNIQIRGAGSVDPPAGYYTYVDGTIVDITATPDAGYLFEGWTGEVADADSPSTTIKMNSDKTVTATFSKTSFSGLVWGGVAAGGILIIGGVIWSIAKKRPTHA